MIKLIQKVKAVEITGADFSLKDFFKNFDGTKAEINDVTAFMVWITDVALNIAAIVGVFMILYSGFLYISSFGDESKAETAKKTLLWSIVGTCFIIFAKVIIMIIGIYLYDESKLT